MASTNGRGYSPNISSFQKDLYSELEKPISTQNLDLYLKEFDRVIEHVEQQKKRVESDLASGKTPKSMQGFVDEAQQAILVMDKLNERIKYFEQFGNAKQNFSEQFQKLYSLRNAADTVKTKSQLAVREVNDYKAKKSAPKQKAEEQKSNAEQPLARQAEEAHKSAESIVKDTENVKQAVVNVGNEQPKGEILPVKQVEAESDSLIKKASEVQGEWKKVNMFNPITGKHEDVNMRIPKEEKGQEEAKKQEVEKKNLTTAEKREKAVAEGKYRPIDEKGHFIKNDEEQVGKGSESSSKNESILNDVKNYDQLVAKIIEVKNEANALRSVLTNGKSLNYEQDVAELSKLEKELKSLESTKKQIDSQDKTPIGGVVPQDYEQLVNAIDTYKKEIETISQRMQSGKSTNFQQDKEDLATLQAELKKFEQTKAQIDKGTGATNETTQINGLLGLLKDTIATKLQLSEAKVSLFSSSDMQATMGNISSLNGRMKELNGMWKELASNSSALNAIKTLGTVAKSVGTTIASGLVKGFQMALSGAKQLASAIGSLVSGAFNLLKNAISTTIGNMQKLVSGGFNAVKNGVSAVKKGFESVKNTMTSLVKKGTPNLMKSFGSLKSMLMRRVKRTFISAIFNQAKEGLQQLAKSSDSFNQSMSNIKNSAKQAAGNLAITLGNLIQTIEPALQTILGWFNSVLEAINGLFAMLSGKKTMMVAKKGTDDYAKSLGNASKSAKDLNHQLYGFDEITRQEDNSGGSSGAGKIGYEEQEIGEALGGINDFFKEMLEAFKAGEFEKVGELIGAQLNKAITSISGFIDKLDAKARTWADNITRILNGLVDGINWKDLGKLIGKGLNLAFGVVGTFFKKFKFKNLGQKVALAFKGLFEEVNWDEVGETIANYFNALPRFLSGLFEDMPWGEMGDGFTKGIQSFFNNIDWEARQGAIAKGINGVTTFLTKVITGVNWTQFATDLGTHFNDTINAIKWDDIGKLVSTGINKLTEAFGKLIDSNFFVNLATNLGSMFGGILNNINWEDVASRIFQGLAKLRTAFWSFISNLNLPELASKLAKSINNLFSSDDVNKSWEESRKKTKEGLNGIIKAFRNLVDPQTGIDFAGIGTKIGTGVGNFLKDVDWATLGESIALGVSGLIEAFGKLLVGLDLPNVALKIAEGINALFDPEKGGATFEQVTSAVSEGINGIIGGFANLLDPEKGINFTQIATTLATSINGLIQKTDWATLISTLLELHLDIQQAFWDIIAQIDFADIGQKLADGINGLFTDADGNLDSTKFEKLGKSIGDGIKGIIEGLAIIIEDLDVDAMLQGIFAFIESIPWTDIIVKAITVIAQTLIKAIDALPDLVDGIINLIGQIDWLEIGKAIVSGIAGILGSAVQAVGGIITTIWHAIFGGGEDEEVEVPKILSDNVMNQLRAQMGEAGKELAGALNNALIENIGDAGSDYEAAKQLFLNSAAMLGLGYQEEFEKSMQEWNVSDATTASLAQQAQAVFEACKAPDATVQSIKEQFKQSGIWITDGLAEALIGQGSENIAMALQLMALGVDQETIAALDMSNLNENITAYMNETGTDITTIAGALGADVGKEIGDKIPEAVKNALIKGKQEVASTAQEVQQAADTSETKAEAGKNAKETGELVTEKLTEGLDSEEPAQKTDETTSAVKEKYEALPDEVKPYAEQLMEYIVTALGDQDGTVKSAIEAVAQGAVDRAKEILNGETGIEIATTFLNGIRDGINANNNATDGVVNSVSVMANRAYLATTPMNYAHGYRIGNNMITGMYNGFHAYSQTLVDFIAHVCNTCAQTARDILGIQSPSKVFAEIGAYTMEGMQIGLEDTGRDAISTVGEIASAMAEAGEDASLENVMGNGLDTVITKLERVTDIFSDMADIIADMGGLEIPTVANGQVLPYRTRVDAQPSNGMSVADGNDLESMLYNAFTRAMGSSDAEQSINITLQVDGRKLTDIVTKYQRQQSRAWGV